MSLRRVTHDQDKMLRIIKKIAEKEGKARTGRRRKRKKEQGPGTRAEQDARFKLSLMWSSQRWLRRASSLRAF